MVKMSLLLVSCLYLLVIPPALADHIDKAGQGTYQPKMIKMAPVSGAVPDSVPFDVQTDYLKIDEASSYINDQSNIWGDKMVGGTIDIKIGTEDFPLVLGTFILSGNNRVIPLFNRTIIDNKVYTDDNIEVTVFLGGTKKNTALGNLLDSMGTFTINAAQNAISTASISPAGSTFLTNVQDILGNGDRPSGIFDKDHGLDFTISRGTLTGSDNFFLAYRGNDEGQTQFVATENAGVYDVQDTSGRLLRNGAWMLFHITKLKTFGGPRAWELQDQQAKTELDTLMQNWQLHVPGLNKTVVAAALTPTANGKTSVGDDMLAAIHQIQADEALSETERDLKSGELSALLASAQVSTGDDNGFTQYAQAKIDIETSLRLGVVPSSSTVRTAFLAAATTAPTGFPTSVATTALPGLTATTPLPPSHSVPSEQQLWSHLGDTVKAEAAAAASRL